MSFGSKLKQYRLGKNLSQEELAKKIGTTKQVISRYENDQRSPKLSIAIEIAEKLSIPLDVLIDDNKLLSNNFNLNKREQALILAYRDQPAMQEAVDKLLGVEDDDYMEAVTDDIVKTIKAADKTGVPARKSDKK